MTGIDLFVGLTLTTLGTTVGVIATIMTARAQQDPDSWLNKRAWLRSAVRRAIDSLIPPPVLAEVNSGARPTQIALMFSFFEPATDPNSESFSRTKVVATSRSGHGSGIPAQSVFPARSHRLNYFSSRVSEGGKRTIGNQSTNCFASARVRHSALGLDWTRRSPSVCCAVNTKRKASEP
jgi:hypothetical protein